MAQDMEWGPSIWGQRFTGSGQWSLRLRGHVLELVLGGQSHVAAIEGQSPLSIQQGIFWTDLTLHPGQSRAVTVDGIPNKHGQAIEEAVRAVVAEQKREAARRAEEERKLSRRQRFAAAYAAIERWSKSVVTVAGVAKQTHRWITQEQVQDLRSGRPAVLPSASELNELAADPDIRASLGDRLDHAERVLKIWDWDLPTVVDQFNENHTTRELEQCRDLFDRVCLALVREPGRHLFAVGDDWQSINRFAGADVSVMTGFEQWCGQGVVLRLQQTFRCPQPLCDVSSRFVSKNPAQIPKKVHSQTPTHGPVLHAFQVGKSEEIQDAILGHLKDLSAQLRAGTVPQGDKGRVSVFLLGRYNDDNRRYLPQQWESHCGDVLTLEFMSMHRSKGSEADYVILPNMTWGGFPNLRQDDPVLALAMPGSDPYPLAEERRLFYVALTRARRSVAMFTVRGRQSPFLKELVEDKLAVVTDTTGTPVRELHCPKCKRGVIEQKHGRYGNFFGCTNYPKCKYKPCRLNQPPHLSQP